MLREELQAVHSELTRLADERDALAALWDERTSAQRMPTGLRGRVTEIRRQLSRLRRRYRDGEVGTFEAGRQLLRIGIANPRRTPVESTDQLLDLRQNAFDPTYRGDRPVLQAKKPPAYPSGTLWKELLAPEHGDEPSFLRASRYLAIKTGRISEDLELTSRLGVSDLRVRAAVPSVNGRARELSGWIPRIPGPRTPIEPASNYRVLHLVKESSPYSSNGFTVRSHQNLLAERAAGLEPVVVTELGFPRSVVGEDFTLVQEVDGIVHHRLDTGLDYMRVPADRWLEDFAWYAYNAVREIRPALIHVASGRRGFETALVALALKEKTGIPVVYEVHSFFETEWTNETAVEEDSEIFRRRSAVEKICMHEADAVLALGAAMRDELVLRGVAVEKISLVPHGVDLESFRPADRDAALAARYRIIGPTVGYVADMDHRREGQEVLIKAASLLRERGVDVQVVLVGDGTRFKGLQELAKLYNVVDRVIFTGPVDPAEIAAHYSLIDVFVVPRVCDRVANYVPPLSLFEAMAMERPVVVSDLPALAEIVDAPNRGRVFAPEDVASLAAVVDELISDSAERERLGQAGCAGIEAERQWQHNGPRFRAVYEDVIERARRTGQHENQGV